MPENLRVLYMVPFSTSEAALDIEAVRVLDGCCHDWIQSVEKVLTDIQNASTKGKQEIKLHN